MSSENKVSRYFSRSEIVCRCGCGADNISKELLEYLDVLRERMEMPIILTSACRCPEWNAKVGGKPDSAHISTDERECLAVDIAIHDSRYRDKLLEIVYSYMVTTRPDRLSVKRVFGRIGIGKDFVHVDISRRIPQNITWVY